MVEVFQGPSGQPLYKERPDYNDCGTAHSTVAISAAGTLLTAAPAGYHFEMIDCSGYDGSGGTTGDDPATNTDFSDEKRCKLLQSSMKKVTIHINPINLISKWLCPEHRRLSGFAGKRYAAGYCHLQRWQSKGRFGPAQ